MQLNLELLATPPKVGLHYVVQTGLEFVIFLPQPMRWDYSHALPHPAHAFSNDPAPHCIKFST